MNEVLHLQVGGTLNPRQHLYVERREDETFLRLLLEGQYVNVLTSRQMGKSSLMMRTVHRLDQRGVRWVTIDLASELGSPPDLDAYYLGLLGKIVRSLRLELDLKAWWGERDTETVNQRLLRFFREVVGERIDAPVVIFLDEIDSTLKLSYTDDLFTAIRGMYNERAIVSAYGRITFCLLGVATPNELIKNRRTTAYNVGTTLELRDFDSDVDDLSPLATALSADPALRTQLLNRVLHWSGGQPYLTQKFCSDIVDNKIGSVEALDEFVARTFNNLDQASQDIHFQQILRFVAERLSDEAATIELYSKILKEGRVSDRTTLAHAELKLSGLVKRDRDGNLVVRNPIYQRLFDMVWVQNTRPRRALVTTRRYAMATSVAFLVLLGAGAAYYTNVVVPEQQRLATLDRLAQLKISTTRTESGDGTRALLPGDISQSVLQEATRLLKTIGPITEIGISRDTQSTPVPGASRGGIDDLSPLAELVQLRSIDLTDVSGTGGRPVLRISSLEALRNLTNLRSLRLDPIPEVRSLEPLEMTNLIELFLGDAGAITSLYPLGRLTRLSSIELDNAAGITDLYPLSGLTNLSSIELTGAVGITDLQPLKGLTRLSRLRLTGVASITDLEPLKGLKNLRFVTLGDGPNVATFEPLSELTSLTILMLYRFTEVTSLDPLAGLTNLHMLGLVDATGITSLEPLRKIKDLELLSLLNASGVRDIEPLRGMVKLRFLSLSGTAVASLEPLRESADLQTLYLNRATNITSLEPLSGLPNLRELNVSGATGITTLAPLKRSQVKVEGASPELLATMQ